MATMTQEATGTATFEVGDGATYCGWSDRKAGTIVEASAKKVTWQRDKATLLNGVNSGEDDALDFAAGGFFGHTSGAQRYEYEADTEAGTIVFTLRQNGRWVRKGCGKNDRAVLVAGRSEHYDFNF